MRAAAEKEYRHIGETRGLANHDHDLVHELNKRLDALWRYDQYIANAESKPEIQEFWRSIKQQDQENVNQLKYLIAGEIKDGCF
jgi:protoheme ferro-lyase